MELAGRIEPRGGAEPLTAAEFETFSLLLERLLASEEARTAWLLGFLFGSALEPETEDGTGT